MKTPAALGLTVLVLVGVGAAWAAHVTSWSLTAPSPLPVGEASRSDVLGSFDFPLRGGRFHAEVLGPSEADAGRPAALTVRIVRVGGDPVHVGFALAANGDVHLREPAGVRDGAWIAPADVMVYPAGTNASADLVAQVYRSAVPLGFVPDERVGFDVPFGIAATPREGT